MRVWNVQVFHHLVKGRWQEYVGLCQEFPLLSWLEPEQEAAERGIRRLVEEVYRDMMLNFGRRRTAVSERALPMVPVLPSIRKGAGMLRCDDSSSQAIGGEC